MLRFLKHVGIILILMWAAITFFVGDRFDEICIEGRISTEQAEMINTSHWYKCPKYREGECVAEENDRVLARECSEFFKLLWRPGKWWPTILRSIHG